MKNNLRALVKRVRERNPELDSQHKLTHVVAGLLVKEFLGIEWMEKHVMGYTAPTDYFRNDWANQERFEVHVLRQVILANLLVNLQFVPGFNEVRSKIKTDNIEAAIAELETARLLIWSRATFRFVTRHQKLGMDYDIEIMFGGQTICADTKCKLESTEKSIQTIVGSLCKARSQVPEDKPAIVFVKVPQTWDSANPHDDSVIEFLEEAADRFFYGYGNYKGTSHVVMVVFYFGITRPFVDATAEIIMMKCCVNKKHRHVTGVDWESIVAPKHGDTMLNRPSLWIDVVDLCK